jgi:hypothetical protein
MVTYQVKIYLATTVLVSEKFERKKDAIAFANDIKKRLNITSPEDVVISYVEAFDLRTWDNG